ncbi:hypothetical protein ACM45N_001520 [Cronobacter sakazakii]
MDEEVECDICGKGIAAVAVYSGDGNEELCHECYHDIYDIDDEAVEYQPISDIRFMESVI